VKKLFISFFVVFFSFNLISQNEEVKCIKTTWPLLDTQQINSYNFDNKEVQTIRIEANGDTIQWFKNIYNQFGRLEESNMLKNTYSPLMDIEYFYDKNNELDYYLRYGQGKLDTVKLSAKEKQKNEHGDPVFDPLQGELFQQYDENGNRIYFAVINEEGDTISRSHHFYNNLNLLVKYTVFEIDYFFNNDSLYTTTYLTYNDSNQLIREEEFDKSGICLSTSHHEYNKEFRIRSHGNVGDYLWEMLFEIINCDNLD